VVRTRRKPDEIVSVATEDLARTLTRRRLFGRAGKAIAATAAASTLGAFGSIKTVFATCTCSYIAICNGTCPGGGGCPSGYTVCTLGQCGGCIYSSGQWVSCTGQGTCQQGYELCTDCKSNTNGCSGACTCKSNCICCGCCTPEEVQTEQARLAAQAARN